MINSFTATTAHYIDLVSCRNRKMFASEIPLSDKLAAHQWSTKRQKYPSQESVDGVGVAPPSSQLCNKPSESYKITLT